MHRRATMTAPMTALLEAHVVVQTLAQMLIWVLMLLDYLAIRKLYYTLLKVPQIIAEFKDSKRYLLDTDLKMLERTQVDVDRRCAQLRQREARMQKQTAVLIAREAELNVRGDLTWREAAIDRRAAELATFEDLLRRREAALNRHEAALDATARELREERLAIMQLLRARFGPNALSDTDSD